MSNATAGISQDRLSKNERELSRDLDSEFIKQLRDLGLGALVERLVGAGAAVITVALGLIKSRIDRMRSLALDEIREQYGDQRIHMLGQQVAGILDSDEIWSFLHTVGGTVWVQNVPITSDTDLNFAVFWHPDPKFELAKDTIRVYRGQIQCTIDDGPKLYPGR